MFIKGQKNGPYLILQGWNCPMVSHPAYSKVVLNPAIKVNL
jgi:hypothetical protein